MEGQSEDVARYTPDTHASESQPEPLVKGKRPKDSECHSRYA